MSKTWFLAKIKHIWPKVQGSSWTSSPNIFIPKNGKCCLFSSLSCHPLVEEVFRSSALQSCHHRWGCFGLAFGPAIIFHANFKPQVCPSRMPASCCRMDQVCMEMKTEMRWDGQAGPSLQWIPINVSKQTSVKALHVNWYGAQFTLLKHSECLQKY